MDWLTYGVIYGLAAWFVLAMCCAVMRGGRP